MRNTETAAHGDNHGSRDGELTTKHDVRPAARKTVARDVSPDEQLAVLGQALGPRALEVAPDQDGASVRMRLRVRPPRIYRGSDPGQAPGHVVFSGEGQWYLGREYQFILQRGTATAVTFQRGRLLATVAPGAGSDQVGRALEAWYRRRAQQVFQQRLDACYARLAAFTLELPYPRLKLRTMRKRWGSCSGAGVIRLNLLLIHAPRACLDTAIIHELCHLREPNHSKRFYALLDQVLPEWRELQEKLNSPEFYQGSPLREKYSTEAPFL